MKMQAIILATGEKEKLAPLTTTMPSPMLPIANRPVMSFAVELLARQGIKDILVSLYAQGGSVESYFAGGGRWGVTLQYILQQTKWGSAGALKWAAGALRETAVVLPADALIDLDIAAAHRVHQAHDQALTAILYDAGETPQPPIVWLAEDGRLCPDSNQGAPCVFTGAYIIEPQLLTAVPTHTHFEIDTDLIPALLADGFPVYGYKMAGYWNPLETFGQLQFAQKTFL
ncbi:MAG: nucleotidyltransferase family protein, partial [Anaerolineales bacterium]|nr:nucleotidyltransferase family protein [Anaerolineales bacterium]